MSKRAYSAEDKFKILKAYEDGHYSISEIASIHEVNRSTIMEWKYKWDTYRPEGLKESSTWKKYSQELKLSAIREYQSGAYSLREIARKYEISDKTILRQWIKQYNEHREIKATTEGISAL